MIGVVIVVVVVAIFVVSLTLRRHGETASPARGWERTDEVFRDPSTGRVMRVWIDPADRSRHYVPDRNTPG